ncbi:hypothetical protein [Nonomuraea candida]|uniref:hypothetical protein n=1 Tax=Nonomuraea candida TaxID=359159 RepID=UPI0005BD11A9|nr:hypothetical protein [Nonomuraea candida]
MTENISAIGAHEWQAATYVPVTAEQLQSMTVTSAGGATPQFELPAGTELDVIAVNCRRCMRPFAEASEQPCIAV